MTWLTTSSGVPHLAPDLQLLYKAKGLRPKDDADARAVIPALEARRRTRLSGWLEDHHPWQELLDRGQ